MSKNQTGSSLVCASGPYKMNDARAFTDYRPTCLRESQLFGSEGAFPSEHDYRMYLIRNAENLMSDLRKNAFNSYNCPSCYKETSYGTMLPEKQMLQCNETTCNYHQIDDRGIGTGRNYNKVQH